jgi:hypothetical protein
MNMQGGDNMKENKKWTRQDKLALIGVILACLSLGLSVLELVL